MEKDRPSREVARVGAIDAKIDALPAKKDLAAESKKVIDAFNKKLGIEIKGVVKAVDGTRDALARAVDESIAKVNARIDTMTTKDDLKHFTTRDEFNVLSRKVDGMDKKLDKLLEKR